MSKTAIPSHKSLLNAIEAKLIPWARSEAMSRVLIAATTFEEANSREIPPGMRLTERPQIGPRVPIRGPRTHLSGSIDIARWPDDAQSELRIPALLCVTKGEVELRFGNYIAHCREGHFILVPPGVPRPDGGHSHFEEPVDAHRYGELFWLSPWFSRFGMECWICHSHGHRHWNEAGDDVFFVNQSIFFTYQTLFDEAINKGSGYRDICGHFLISLLGLLQRELRENQVFLPGHNGPQPIDVTELQDPIVRAQEYVRSHLSQPLGIEAAAQHVYLSRAQFIRRFRQATGQSFNEFVTDNRIEEARRLLLDSDWSVAMIANFVGLRPAQFRKVFLERTGESPSAFRQHHSPPNQRQP